MDPQFDKSSDEELARASATGVLEAFEVLVSRYEARVYRYAFTVCRDAEDAKEVCQDTFVRAWTAIARFDPRRSFAAWLFTLARRKCIDHLRRPRLDTTPALPEVADSASPARNLVSKEEEQGIWAIARRDLSQTQFDALWMRYTEEMPTSEIGQALGKTEIHVKVILFRARSILSRSLGLEHKRRNSETPAPSIRVGIARRVIGGEQL